MQRWSVVVQRPNSLIQANVIRRTFVEIVDGMPPKVIHLHGMSWYMIYLAKTFVTWTFRSDFSAWLHHVYPEFRMLLGDQTSRGCGMKCFRWCSSFNLNRVPRPPKKIETWDTCSRLKQLQCLNTLHHIHTLYTNSARQAGAGHFKNYKIDTAKYRSAYRMSSKFAYSVECRVRDC